MQTNKIETELAIERSLQLPKMTLQLKSDDVVYCIYHLNAVVFRHDVEEGVIKRIELFGDKPRHFIVDLNQLRGISSDARRYFGSNDGGYNIKSVAFVVNSEQAESMVLSYLEESDLNYPTKFFRSVNEARVWVATLD